MEWWREWFDEKYLDVVAIGLTEERTEWETEALISMLDVPRNAKILDVACGHGRTSNRMAQRGYQVVGNDISDWALSKARSDSARQNLKTSFVQMDIRQMSFENEFDGAIFINTVLGAFESPEDDQKIINGIAKALVSGGKCVIQSRHRDMIVRKCPPLDQFWEIDNKLILESWVFDPITSIRTGKIKWFENGQWDSKPISYSRYYTITEILDMINLAELKIDALYGDFDKGDVSLDSNLIVVCHKPTLGI